MELCIKNDNSLSLIKHNGTYTLAVYGEDYGRVLVWQTDKHKELTDFVNSKLFPQNLQQL